MGMFLRRSKQSRDPLAVAMSGVRLGERVLQVGVDDAHLVGQIAAKTGLSGAAASVVADAQQAARAKAGADQAGVLIDISVAASGEVPHPDRSFDVAVVHSASSLLATLDAAVRLKLLTESARVLRPGGRIIVIEPGTRTGFRSVLRRVPPAQALYDGAGGILADLRSAGFSPVRELGDREGLRFAEGLKPGPSAQ
jgi:demethylmenaquinone methyltransferase/2-methoxy-6-polyprenyl-1,4-benzoquinol methylase